MDDLISKQIEEARERGDFDNLPGTGKPLRMNEERMVPPELRLAYRMMREHDVLPDWIAEAKLIEEELKRAQQKLERAKRHFKTAQSTLTRRDIQTVRARLDAEDRWKDAQKVFVNEIQDINRKIVTYNLKVPASHLTRDLLVAERELGKLVS